MVTTDDKLGPRARRLFLLLKYDELDDFEQAVREELEDLSEDEKAEVLRQVLELLAGGKEDEEEDEDDEFDEF